MNRELIPVVCEMWPATRCPEGCKAVLRFLDVHRALAVMNGQNTDQIEFLRGIVWYIGQQQMRAKL